MAHTLTSIEYKEIQDQELCVVSFKDGIRTLTYGGLNYKKAIEHCIKKQKQGEICLIIPISNFGSIEDEATNKDDTLQGHLNYLKGEN